jgi:anti-sigma regulatory factor (Ser/Thr protein kinase)
MSSGDHSRTDADAQHGAATLVSPLRRANIPAEATVLVGVRKAVEDWALAAGLSRETVTDIVAASYEAMANAAEHAYRNRSGTIDLLATCTDTDVEVVVRDRGEWRPPPVDPGFRGRGLVMIRSMSRAEIEPGPHGTTVRMRWFRPSR